MSTRRRHITAAVLLASYLLASADVWLHTARKCSRVADAASRAVMTPNDAGGCEYPSCCCEGGPAGTARSSDGVELDGKPHPVSNHHGDDCIICRFQLTKKLAEVAPQIPTCCSDCPEPLVLDVPLYHVASLLTTPESRAPPVLA